MRILHYGLGYPPERTGGLINYTTSLMKEQIKQGNTVAYLYPGRTSKFNKKVAIREGKVRIKGVKSFELINSLPLPVFGGIKSPEDFMTKTDLKIYSELLTMFNPDVIHVHTLMGIHIEFFQAANKLGKKIIYTTCDYFGISPNPTFYFNQESWDEKNDLNFWLNVSEGAMTTNRLRILQNPYYYILRDTVKKFKKTSFQKEKHFSLKTDEEFSIELKNKFEELRNYYQDIFSRISYFHFNSSIARDVFFDNLRMIPTYNNSIVNITNSKIKDSSKNIILNLESLKTITYMGPYAEFKGFNDFIEIAKKCKNMDLKFEIYGEDINIELPKNVVNKGRFSYDESEEVYKNAGLLLILGRWKETFGFLTIEATNHETPIFVTDMLGAKDVLPDELILDSKDIVNQVYNLLNSKIKIEYKVELESLDSFTYEILKIYKEIIK
jgi:glycosyltransferase involved in cell wall biosynthesis